jgi:plastocyanin
MRLSYQASIAALLLAACGGGGGGPTQPDNNNNQVGTVQGTVVDQSGAAVPSASVALQRTGQSTRNTTTNASGSYSFASVATGAWTVAVTPPSGFSLGSGTGSSAVTVVAGQQASVAPIVLNKLTQGGPPPAAVDVSMVNTSFNPQQVEVAAGGTVRFTNNDGVDHNASSNQFLTGNLTPGQSREVRLNNAGTVTYSCTLHAGMTGSIVVR